MYFFLFILIFEKLVGGTELENCFLESVHVLEVFRLTLVKKKLSE